MIAPARGYKARPLRLAPTVSISVCAAGESPGLTRYFALRKEFRASPECGDFVYLSAQVGFFPAVSAEDSTGGPHDFSDSALLAGVFYKPGAPSQCCQAARS